MFESIFLGFLQGLTEFLPVSSSAHLILARSILDFQLTESLLFDVILHFATALAVVVYFRKDILRLIKNLLKIISGRGVENQEKIFLFAIIVGTIPAALVGFFLHEIIDFYLRHSIVAITALLVGSLVFVLAEKKAKNLAEQKLTVKKGFLIGIFQTLALIPGLSRSGMTISCGLFLGLRRDYVARFSFILSLPIILGSGLVIFISDSTTIFSSDFGLSFLLGGIVSFLVGILAIHFLINLLKTKTLIPFAWYRAILALVLLFFLV